MSKLLIFPTDTVYGIGASVFDKDNIKRIYEIKHRPLDKPLAVLCSSLEQIEGICELNDSSRKLIKKYLPGALTIIVPAKKNIEESMGLKMVGVRIPNHPLALRILEENGPMATTSVNESGDKPINEYQEIVAKYKNVVDMIYSSDFKSSNISSTVIMLDDHGVKLIREGEISYDDILTCLS